MTATNCSTTDFSRRLSYGQLIEACLADNLEELGAEVEKITPDLSTGFREPRMPGLDAKGQAAMIKAPDLKARFGEGPTIYVEVKSLKLAGTERQPAFQLDEPNRHRLLRCLDSGYPTILAVHSKDFLAGGQNSAGVFVDAEELRPGRHHLPKRRSNGRPFFLIPLDLFTPIDKLPERYRRQ